MKIPSKYLLSNLLHLNARCEKGLDHGIGVMVWMHPPVHRILGWVTRPSKLSLKRLVWRLDQINSISYEQIFVEGYPEESDQATINRLPTLVDSILLNDEGQKIGHIADFIFNTKTGKIIYYLVSRSNPKLPGTSRWRLDINQINDQEAGCVSSIITNLDDLPLLKSSIRQDFFKNTKKLRDNLLDFSNIANEKLEGWLDENNLEDESDLRNDDDFIYRNEYNRSNNYDDNEGDPWI